MNNKSFYYFYQCSKCVYFFGGGDILFIYLFIYHFYLFYFCCGKIHITIFTILTIFKWHSYYCATITTTHLQNSFDFEKMKLNTLNNNSTLSSLPPSPGNHHSTSCLYDFDFSKPGMCISFNKYSRVLICVMLICAQYST